MKILKKILKWLGIFIGVIILLIVIASVVLIIFVDKEFIENQMISELNRHVTIKDIDVGIFSVVSGITVKEVKISNFKTPKQLEALKGKPVTDVFVGLESFNFKAELMPLIDKKVVLKKLTLNKPTITVVKGAGGGFNFDDLLVSKPLTPEEKAELAKAEAEAKKEAAEAKKEEAPEDPNKPLTADDIPLEVKIGEIGIKNGVVTYIDKGMNQTFQLYNLTFLVHSIEIDPKALDKKNSVGVQFNMGVKTVGKVNSKSVQSFDIGLSANGTVKPFDVKTRIMNPEASLKMGSPYGTVTGLQIFEKMNSIEQISKYCGKLSFLKKALKWKKANVGVWYKGGLVKLSKGTLKTSDFAVTFKGETNVNTKSLDVDLDMILGDKHKNTIRNGINNNVKKIVKGPVAKVVKPDQVTDAALKPLVNSKGQIYMKYKITGTMNSPNTKLVHPQIGSLSDVVKKMGGSVGDIAEAQAKAAAGKAVKKAKSKATNEAKKRFKKFF
ncbi:MAG: AsmA family protein [bacterium]|nr:AsmA family protein [bacterium]